MSICETGLSADDKITECARIALNPLTAAAIDYAGQERERWFRIVWEIALNATVDRTLTDAESLKSVLNFLAPRCGIIVRKDSVSLFAREPALMEALRHDDMDKLAEGLLELIQAKRYTKQYDLGIMLHDLAQKKPLLHGITDTSFLRKYAEIYWMIWQNDTLEALDVMMGLLLENRVQSAEEEFLQLYLSVAALLEQIPAFLFGKTKLAQFYLRQKRTEDCQAILNELEMMGVEENEELADIRRQLAALDGQ